MHETYEAPQIAVVADVEGSTAGGKTGDNLDATFPVGTPRGDLLFS